MSVSELTSDLLVFRFYTVYVRMCACVNVTCVRYPDDFNLVVVVTFKQDRNTRALGVIVCVSMCVRA